MPPRKQTKKNKTLVGARTNKKREQKLTTRLMHLNFLVEGYIYNHKPIPVLQAKLCVKECESYKLLHKLDERSRQVVDKIISVMKDIIEDNEEQANHIETIAANAERNTPENFETPVSPVYSLPDTDKEIFESARLEYLHSIDLKPSGVIDLCNNDNHEEFSNIANYMPLEDALSGLTLNDITTAIGETNVGIINDVYSQSILNEYNIDTQEDDTNFMEIIECGQDFDEYEKAYHCVDDKIKENRNEVVRTHEPINSKNNDKENHHHSSFTTKKIPRKRKLKSNPDIVVDFSKSNDCPTFIKKRNAKQSKIPKKVKQTLKPQTREKNNEKLQKGKAETKRNVLDKETNKIELSTTAVSEKLSENAVTNTTDNIILANTKPVHDNDNLLENIKSFIDTIDLSWIEGLKYVRVIDKEEYTTDLHFEDSFWDNLEYPSNWDDTEFEI